MLQQCMFCSKVTIMFWFKLSNSINIDWTCNPSFIEQVLIKTGGRLTEIHFTFSVDRKFLIIWAFDRILFGRLTEFIFRFQVRLGQVRLGQVRLGQVRLGQVRLGQVRSGQVRLGYFRLGLARLGKVKIIRSSEKCQKFRSTDYETFDQLIKHNFDQLIFGQVIIPLDKSNNLKYTFNLEHSKTKCNARDKTSDRK